MGSALRNTGNRDPKGVSATADVAGTPSASEGAALKQQVAERLAAHRERRGKNGLRAGGGEEASAAGGAGKANRAARSSKIAATVAERYAQSPSYRSLLAAEAERAIEQAEAAAEIAAVNAQAVVRAQQIILDELDDVERRREMRAPQPQAPVIRQTTTGNRLATPAPKPAAAEQRSTPEPLAAAAPARMEPLQPLELTEPSEPAQHVPGSWHAAARVPDQGPGNREITILESSEPLTALPANLIEFPRQLVAARRARPRYAEGPLRQLEEEAQDGEQLSIFEVETVATPFDEQRAEEVHQWTPIWLDQNDAVAGRFEDDYEDEYVPPATQREVLAEARREGLAEAKFLAAAPMSHRLMAGVVDFCIVATGLLAFATAFGLTVGQGVIAEMTASPGLALLGAVIASFMVLDTMYKGLFFTFAEATPGMRYARLEFRTLSDQSPTRAAIRRRVYAGVLSVGTLGIGFLWALFDEAGLSWHDRISGMYSRSY